MSDSFADLWNSTAPTKPVQPQKLGAVNTNPASRRPQQDVFSLLSSTGSSTPNSRPITPSLAAQPKVTQKKTPLPSGGDAFSGLLSGSLAGGPGDSARMTIAERAAQAEKERLASLQKRQQAVKQSSAAWDGLDMLANTSSSPSPAFSKPSNTLGNDDWGFGPAEPAKPTPSTEVAQNDDDDWGLGDFSAPVASNPPSRPPTTSQQQTLWDLEDFSGASSSRAVPVTTHQRPDSPGDFDFGNREDALLDNDSNDEDDILGALSKPVDSIPKHKSPVNNNATNSSPTQTRTSTPNTNPPVRSTSPPPHILGQIVEMGFSVQQARVALASTDTGLDVQAALDALLSNGAGDSPHPRPRSRSPPHDPPPRSATRLLSQATRDADPSPTQGDKDRNLPEQADKLLAQASEIGLSMFNKASSFWKEGKERVQRVYEERAASGAGGSRTQEGSRPGNGGRPKWMQEAPGGHGADDDDDKGHAEPEFSDAPRPKPAATAAPNKHKSNQAPKPESQAAVNLFSDEPVTAYVSPYRRGKPKPQQQTPSAAAPAHSQAWQPSPPTRPKPIPAVSPSSLALSAKHKALGGEKFALGQYSAAETAYTSAIECFPAGHPLLVPLYNNRALTRLKTGEYRNAVEDCTVVLDIIGDGTGAEARELEGAGEDFKEGLVKALKRRAGAWEGLEKWAEAGRDWEALAAIGWARPGVRGEAVRGAGRCRRMVQAASTEGAAGSAPAAKPPPRPSARPAAPAVAKRVGVTAPSQALENLRSASNAAEAEERQRHELKDSVDAKLVAWKGGKEANIRALLGSVDSVLWPELGLAKAGMADLVTPAQVKVRYTRTIARLHPDKLNASNTTLEQRMIANGVFGALNEAWNAFKQ